LQKQELAYLKERYEIIKSENEEKQNEMIGKGMTVNEHSKKQFEKQKKIKLLKTKIDLLEKSLT